MISSAFALPEPFLSSKGGTHGSYPLILMSISSLLPEKGLHEQLHWQLPKLPFRLNPPSMLF